LRLGSGQRLFKSSLLKRMDDSRSEEAGVRITERVPPLLCNRLEGRTDSTNLPPKLRKTRSPDSTCFGLDGPDFWLKLDPRPKAKKPQSPAYNVLGQAKGGGVGACVKPSRSIVKPVLPLRAMINLDQLGRRRRLGVVAGFEHDLPSSDYGEKPELLIALWTYTPIFTGKKKKRVFQGGERLKNNIWQGGIGQNSKKGKTPSTLRLYNEKGGHFSDGAGRRENCWGVDIIGSSPQSLGEAKAHSREGLRSYINRWEQ